VPAGLTRYSDFWSHALFPGYDFRSRGHPTLGYYVSAGLGTLIIGGAVIGLFALGRAVRRGRAGREELERVAP
jgi:hypothetical protein